MKQLTVTENVFFSTSSVAISVVRSVIRLSKPTTDLIEFCN